MTRCRDAWSPTPVHKVLYGDGNGDGSGGGGGDDYDVKCIQPYPGEGGHLGPISISGRALFSEKSLWASAIISAGHPLGKDKSRERERAIIPRNSMA